MSTLLDWISILYYSILVLYSFTILLSVGMYKEFRNGFLNEKPNKFASKFEAVLYYCLASGYITCLVLMGILMYFMGTILQVLPSLS